MMALREVFSMETPTRWGSLRSPPTYNLWARHAVPLRLQNTVRAELVEALQQNPFCPSTGSGRTGF